MLCPVCERDVLADEFMLHAMYNHPQFFVVWASFSLPTLAPNFALLANTLQEEYDHDEFENMEYEELLELCNMVGYHKIGVKNVDEVAPLSDKGLLDSDWKCTICLDAADSIQDVRKITECGHCFCSQCIEKWFEENRSCPVCKKEVEVENIVDLEEVE